jgi:hypothetical protein
MNSPAKPDLPAPTEPPLLRLFAALFGALLGLSLLKFGGVPLFEDAIDVPSDIYEFVFFTPWPIRWAYALLAVVTVSGLLVARWNANAPLWLLASPFAWLLWQLAATLHTLDPRLTNPTLAHLLACIICFCLGFFSLSRVRNLSGFWAGLVIAFLLVLAVGWQQHFGGLKQTRDYFYHVEYPRLQALGKVVPPENLKKLDSDRIFSTLFYPNTLAGALLLLLPAMLGLAGQSRRFTPAARGFLAFAIGLGALGCLYWSGSKGGWLLMLLLGLLALLRLRFDRRLKIALVATMLVLGFSGFFWKYSSFFRKGAPSVGARFDYWQAAVRTAMANPVFGTGPGTFYIAYRQIKRPESEPAKLVHNDYLEQASDSGWPGFLAYVAFISGALSWTAPRARGRPASSTPSSKPATLPSPDQDWQTFLVWLGLLGWALQGLMEFGLYVPALAWPAFSLFGWILGQPRLIPRLKTPVPVPAPRNPIDKPQKSR